MKVWEKLKSFEVWAGFFSSLLFTITFPWVCALIVLILTGSADLASIALIVAAVGLAVANLIVLTRMNARIKKKRMHFEKCVHVSRLADKIWYMVIPAQKMHFYEWRKVFDNIDTNDTALTWTLVDPSSGVVVREKLDLQFYEEDDVAICEHVAKRIAVGICHLGVPAIVSKWENRARDEMSPFSPFPHINDLAEAAKDPDYPEASRKVFLKRWLELSSKSVEVKPQGRLVVE